jgi:hypothetical protein
MRGEQVGHVDGLRYERLSDAVCMRFERRGCAARMRCQQRSCAVYVRFERRRSVGCAGCQKRRCVTGRKWHHEACGQDGRGLGGLSV